MYDATGSGGSGSWIPISRKRASALMTRCLGFLRAFQDRNRSRNVGGRVDLDQLPPIVSPVVEDVLYRVRDERNGCVLPFLHDAPPRLDSGSPSLQEMARAAGRATCRP